MVAMMGFFVSGPLLEWITLLLCLLPFTGGVHATSYNPPKQCKEGLSSYDFIIIGGGTAGLTLGTRLSQRLTSDCVLVIQAGIDGRAEPRIYIPGRKGSTIGTPYDWNLTTVPQPGAANRRLAMTRGKVLGGSSALNLMTWDRGSEPDYDAWEALGNSGWNFKSFLGYMLKVENFAPSQEYDSSGSGYESGVGKGGIIQTLINRILPKHQLAFIPTLNALGVKTNLRSLNGNPLGVMRQPSNIRKSDYTRSYSTAYLDAAGPNLVVLLGTRVAKVNFNGKVASGVILESGKVISTRKEVILSAGSFQSPGLLELSGIGNTAILAANGISKVISHLPGVGENLQDHIRIQSSYQLKPEYLSFDRLRYNTTFAAEQLALYNANEVSLYDYTGSGYTYLTWAQVSKATAASQLALAKSVADVKSPIDRKKLTYLTDATLSTKVPQLEVIFSDGYTGVKGYPAVGTPLYGAEFFSLIAAVQHPFSKGSVHINTSSIAVPPIISPNYLSNKYDLAAAVTAAKYIRRIANTAPLSGVWSSEYEPGPAVSTDEQWESFARNTTLSIYHPVGTCAMLPKADGGVVDPALKVYGVKGLRVVDASIIPILPSAHIQTAVYGIAEKAADLIVKEWK